MNRHTGVLVLLLSLPLAGCRSMTTAQFVNSRLSGDAGFSALAKAAQSAADAYHTIADTPIDQIDTKRDHIVELIVRARDSYRRARTYTINGGEPTLDLSGVHLTDDDDPRSSRVQVDGTSAYVRVTVAQKAVRLVGMATSRGLDMMTFDSSMVPSIDRVFMSFLAGDNVDVDVDLLIRLRRSESQVDAPVERAVTRRPEPAKPVVMRERTMCPNCGTAVPSDTRFCPHCGELQQPLPGEKAFCESCGARYPDDQARFCPGCGLRRPDR
jgi:hypothetical protein